MPEELTNKSIWENATSAASCKPLTIEMVKDFFKVGADQQKKYDEKLREILNNKENQAYCNRLLTVQKKLIKAGRMDEAMFLGMMMHLVMSHPSEKPVVSREVSDAADEKTEELLKEFP